MGDLGFKWVGAIAAALGLMGSPPEPQAEDHLRYRKSKKRREKRVLHRNMVTHGKRVRRKHRRAA